MLSKRKLVKMAQKPIMEMLYNEYNADEFLDKFSKFNFYFSSGKIKFLFIILCYIYLKPCNMKTLVVIRVDRMQKRTLSYE